MAKVFLIVFVLGAGKVHPIIGGGYANLEICKAASAIILRDLVAQGVTQKHITSTCVDSRLWPKVA